MAGIWKGVLTGVGLVCVGLAVAGVFLPLVPTTPFVLLAAICFARSSDRFYAWLAGHRWFGATIRDYREGRGLPLRQKIATIAIMWGTTIPTGLLVIPSWWGRVALWSVSASVTLYLVRLPTRRTPPTGHGRPAEESDAR